MKSDLFSKTWPFLAVALANSIWGINFIVSKLVLQEIPIMSLAFLRFALAALFLLPFLIVGHKENIKFDKNDLPKIFIAGVCMVGLNIAFFYEGLSKISAINASVLTMTVPVISVLFGWWFLKEKIYTANLFGILLGFLGALIILGVPILALEGNNFSISVTGDILIILSSISWVIGATVSRRIIAKYSALVLTMAIFLVGVLTFFIPALNDYIQNPLWINQVSYLGVLGVLFLSLLSSVSAYFLFNWGLERLGVIKADLFQYLQTVVAVILAVFVLNERISFSIIVGAILIGLGVYWGTLGKGSHKLQKAHHT